MEYSFFPSVLPCSQLHPNKEKTNVKHIIAWFHHSAQKNQVSGVNISSVLSCCGCAGPHTGKSGRFEYFRPSQTWSISSPSPVGGIPCLAQPHALMPHAMPH